MGGRLTGIARERREPLRISYHEAGHAVAAIRWGVGVQSISVLSRDDSRGRVTVTPSWRRPPGDLRREQVDALVVMCYAGGFSEARYTGRYSSWNTGPDRRDAQSLALSHGYSPLATRRYLSWLRTLAKDFIASDRSWAEVGAVAEALVSRGRLSGNEVKQLLAERLFAKVGTLATLGEE